MKRNLTALAIAIVACIMATPAHATLQVIIGGTNTGVTVTGGTEFTDQGVGDEDLTVGKLTFTYGGLGTFTIDELNSGSKSPIGILNMTLNGTLTSATTFTLAISDNNFSVPTPPLMLADDVHGTSAPLGGATGSISGTGYFGADDINFNTGGSSTTGVTSSLNGTFGVGLSGPILSGNPYSLTEFLNITLTPGTGTDQSLQLNANLDAVQVPEPASVMLLGGILFLTAASLRRRLGRV